jgi:hypothetical protein
MAKFAVNVEGAKYEVEAPDENTAWQWAYTTHMQEQKPAAKSAAPKIPERTMGESVTDVGAGLLSGLGGLGQFPGQLYGLATGDFSKTGLYGAAQNLEEYGKGLKSAGLQAREAAAQRAVQEAQKKGEFEAFKTSLGQTVSDPALLANFFAEQLPQQIPAALAAIISPSSSKNITMLREAAKKAASGVAKQEAEVAAKKAAVDLGAKSAIRTAAVQQGADIGTGTYETMYKYLTEEQKMGEKEAANATINYARAAGVGGAALSLLAQKLPGSQAFERALAGEKTGMGRITGALAGAIKETPGENIEEVGGRALQNLAMRQVNKKQNLTEGFGETAAQATLGAAGMGGAAGIASGGGKPTAESGTKTAEEADALDVVKQGEQTAEQAGEKPNIVKEAIKKQSRKQLAKTSAETDAGVTDVTKPIKPAGGEGAGVDLQSTTGTDTQGAVTPPADGVVPPESNARTPPAGTGGQPSTVTLSPEAQIAKDLLDAVDKGGVPLNPSKINAIARSLGLDVKKSAKPEEIIARLREAVTRASQSVEQTVTPPLSAKDRLSRTNALRKKEQQQQIDPKDLPMGGEDPMDRERREEAQLWGLNYDSYITEAGLDADRFYTDTSAAEIKAYANRYKLDLNDYVSDAGFDDNRFYNDVDAKMEASKEKAPAPQRGAFQELPDKTRIAGQTDEDLQKTVDELRQQKREKLYKLSKEEQELYNEQRQAHSENIEQSTKQIAEDLVNEQGNLPDATAEDIEDDRSFVTEQLGKLLKLPLFSELTPYEKSIYFGGQAAEFGNSVSEHIKATQRLLEYRADLFAVQRESRKKARNETKRGAASKESTETAAKAAADKTKKDFEIQHSYEQNKPSTLPNWNSLSEENKQVYRDAVQQRPHQIGAAEQELAFRKIRKTETKFSQSETEDKRQRMQQANDDLDAQMYAATEAMIENDPKSQGDVLTAQMIRRLREGDVKGVLQWMADNARGAKTAPLTRVGVSKTEIKTRKVKQEEYLKLLAENTRKRLIEAGEDPVEIEKEIRKIVKDAKDKLKYKRGTLVREGSLAGQLIRISRDMSSKIYRNLAESLLSAIGDTKINVVIDENLHPKDGLAKYDLKTNTMTFGPFGFTETAFLHELTHAVTAKIIRQFFKDPSVLTDRQRKGVEHLQTLFALTQTRLGKKFPAAFTNLYEFVAYSMTDLRFQNELVKIQLDEAVRATQPGRAGQVLRDYNFPTGKTVWDAFTATLAYIYKAFTPSKRTTSYLLPVENFGEKPGKKGVSTGVQALPKGARDAITEADEALLERMKEKGPPLPDEIALLTGADEAVKDEESTFDEGISDGEAALAGVKSIPFTQTLNTPPPGSDVPVGTIVTKGGITNLLKDVHRQPGYKGNILLEAAAAFNDIMVAPEAVEAVEAVEELATQGSAAATPPTPAAKTITISTPPAPRKQVSASFEDQVDDSVGSQMPRTKQNLYRLFTTAEGGREIIRRFANNRHAIKAWEAAEEMSNKIIYAGEKINAVYNEITMSTGRARNIYERELEKDIQSIHDTMQKLAEKSGVDFDRTLKTMHVFARTLHERERRHIKFLFYVPLDLASATRRGEIIQKFRKGDKMTEDEIKDYRKELEKFAKPTSQGGNIDATNGYSWNDNPTSYVRMGEKGTKMSTEAENEQSPDYNVIADLDEASRDAAYKEYASYKYKEDVDAILKKIEDLQKKTTKLNKESNYWSQPVDNVVKLYNFQHYVPFKGRANAIKDNQFDIRTGAGRELQEAQNTFEGRISDSNNTIVQTMLDATHAAARAGRSGIDGQGLTLAIRNAVNSGLIKGITGDKDKRLKIKFEDRYKGDVDVAKLRGANAIFHYEPDGTITIITIDDPHLREAIRRTYRESNPVVSVLNSATSFVGQMHTRYNIPFAPANFLIDGLTNTFNIAAKEGWGVGVDYLKQLIGQQVLHGGLYKAGRFSALYTAKKFGEIERLAKTDPDFRDLNEYVNAGGKVSYIRSLTAEGLAEDFEADVKGTNVFVKTKKGVDKVIDVWSDSFELASRVAAYRILKQQYMSKGMSEAEAKQKAVGDGKNLANFEQVGEWGQAMGAMFMFFRPAATGAVRAIEALAPAFVNADKALKMLPNQGTYTYEFKDGERVYKNPEAVEKYKKEHDKRRQHARAVAGGLIGMGMMVYAMGAAAGGDDDLGRNKAVTDDMARYTRYARFHFRVGDRDFVFQLPWGFGLGAFASAGAQMAGYVHGAVMRPEGDRGFFGMLSNIMEVTQDSFLPIPVSRIDKYDKPAEWIADTFAPSILRPMIEYAMNTDALGRDIYNAQKSRVSEVFVGGDNIPELYKGAARMLYDITGVPVSPNVMYFFANNYADGLARLMHNGVNVAQSLVGNKEFDPRTDTLLFDRFFGAVSNVDAREFSKVSKEIKDIASTVKTLQDDPERYAKYLAKNPTHEFLVEHYNSAINGALKDFQEQKNSVRKMQELTQAERTAMLRYLTLGENIVKLGILNEFAAMGVKP